MKLCLIQTTSVADPGCLSRIPDPDFYPSRIPNPKTATKERGEKNCYHTFFVVTNFTKLNLILFLKCRRKKFGTIFKELSKFLPKKFSQSSQKYEFGIRDPEKTYPGSRGQKGTGSRIQIRNTANNPAHCRGGELSVSPACVSRSRSFLLLRRVFSCCSSQYALSFSYTTNTNTCY